MRIDWVDIIEATTFSDDRAVEMALGSILIGVEVEFLGVVGIEMGHEDFKSFVLDRRKSR
jgi:hypothetical protein